MPRPQIRVTKSRNQKASHPINDQVLDEISFKTMLHFSPSGATSYIYSTRNFWPCIKIISSNLLKNSEWRKWNMKFEYSTMPQHSMKHRRGRVLLFLLLLLEAFYSRSTLGVGMDWGCDLRGDLGMRWKRDARTNLSLALHGKVTLKKTGWWCGICALDIIYTWVDNEWAILYLWKKL